MNKKLLVFCAGIFIPIVTYVTYHHICQTPTVNTRAEVLIDTFYGPVTIHEPVLIDLIEHPAMQRLKKVRQYGVCHFFRNRNYGNFHRFEHSLGVFALLRKIGASLPEQIAGLLHDVSHTVFSHVGDHVFAHQDGKSAYQDDIHAWYLNECGLASTLSKHGFSVDDVLHKKGNFAALEQDLPNICADRLDYNLQGGVLQNIITKQEADAILAAITFENGIWYFTDAHYARLFAEISLYLTEFQWGHPDNQVAYTWTAQALRRMVDNGELSLHDIHFGTDDDIWHKMCTSADNDVRLLTQKIIDNSRFYRLSSPKKADLISYAKFRGIDPHVATDKGIVRLTSIDPSFKAAYEELQLVMRHGWPIRFTDEYELTAQLQARTAPLSAPAYA